MLHSVMEPEVIQGLGPHADKQSQLKALAFFEQMKSSDQGLELAATALAQNLYTEHHVNFFLWQVLEHQIKYRMNELSPNLKAGIQSALLTWLQNYSKKPGAGDPNFLKNKAAQIFALIFAKQYLTEWVGFPQDVLRAATGSDVIGHRMGDHGVEMYLRILLSIDSEVVDRTVSHTTQEQNHYQLIKDTMRERCVKDLADSWLQILTNPSSNSQCVALCLQVIGAYIEWIDINFIANNRFMVPILTSLNPNNDLPVREAACGALYGLAVKGMQPMDKLTLIEMLWVTLDSASILSVLDTDDDENVDFVIKLSKLMSSMASTLIFAANKVEKRSEEQTLLLNAIRAKIPTCLRFFRHDDDDISAQCCDLLRDFLDMEKRTLSRTDARSNLMKEIFYAVVTKLKYDDEYQFDNEGEEEMEFQDYLKSVKVIYDNLAMMCPDLVLSNVRQVLTETLAHWNTFHFTKVEVAIRLVYMLGESLPSNMSKLFSAKEEQAQSPLFDMMTQLVSSEVSKHPHTAVRLQYFETIARYDRFFPVVGSSNPDQAQHLVVNAVQAFLDQRGLRADDPKLRSRCAYLFSRFVKTLGKQLSPYAEEILNQVGQLLVLAPSKGGGCRMLSADDQHFVYELCGHVVVNSDFPPDRSAQLFTALLRPLVQGFQENLGKMVALASNGDSCHGNDAQKSGEPAESLAFAQTLSHAMAYASRTSKAFSNKHTMRSSGCAHVYTDALNVFLLALDVPVHRDVIHSGVRQYLHRMVICLEDDVLPFVPITIRHLLNNQEPRALHDFLPFLNQIINKFKKLIAPFLCEVFMSVVRAVFGVLQQFDLSPADHDDARLTRRSYFTFLHALVTNQLTHVILQQEKGDFDLIVTTLLQGAGEYPDPVGRKLSFAVMSRIIDEWDEADGANLWSLLRERVVPCCFLAPLGSNFDLDDAQTVLALNESANVLKSAFNKQGDKVEGFLRDEYLPSLNLSPHQIQEYCLALRHADLKSFRSYIKVFFMQAKS